jgi:hypothetical protein
MKPFEIRQSGLAVPIEKKEPVGPPQLYYQESLVVEQLPSYLGWLVKEEVELVAVFYDPRRGIGGRWTVAYRHHEPLESEVFT